MEAAVNLCCFVGVVAWVNQGLSMEVEVEAYLSRLREEEEVEEDGSY